LHFINGSSLRLAQRSLFVFLVHDQDRVIVLIDGHQSDDCLGDLVFVFAPARVGPYLYMDADRDETQALRVSKLLLIIARSVNIFGIEVATILVNIIVSVTAHPLRRWWGRSVSVLLL